MKLFLVTRGCESRGGGMSAGSSSGFFWINRGWGVEVLLLLTAFNSVTLWYSSTIEYYLMTVGNCSLFIFIWNKYKKYNTPIDNTDWWTSQSIQQVKFSAIPSSLRLYFALFWIAALQAKCGQVLKCEKKNKITVEKQHISTLLVWCYPVVWNTWQSPCF